MGLIKSPIIKHVSDTGSASGKLTGMAITVGLQSIIGQQLSENIMA
jgi:hypothetical protein